MAPPPERSSAPVDQPSPALTTSATSGTVLPAAVFAAALRGARKPTAAASAR